jgi:DNA-binding NtrC family response regulator
LDCDGDSLTGWAINLGLKGAYLSLDTPPPVNSVVSLRFSLAPQAPDLEVLARVVHIAPRGLAAEFLDLDAHSRSRLHDFVAPLLPRGFTACPYCGGKVTKRSRKQCPACHQSLEVLQNGNMKELDLEEMIGTCEAMREVFNLIRKVAATDVPVLITGASGTGKEMVARAIHERSHRSGGPFVELNCGAIPRELLDSELFGHERGAFTGAYHTVGGHVERAQGGALFLDEVGELPLDLQVKLLHFLQELSLVRLGGRQHLKVDLRIISATNSDLKELIAQGRFREDLYYRLDVVNINLSPLKDRGDDSLIMANVFLKRYASRIGQDIKGFTPEAVAALKNHPWPGNVRELINRVRRAVVMADTPWVTPDNLGLDAAHLTPEPVFNGKTLKQARAEFEARLVAEALKHYRGNVHLASQALKVSRSTMYHFIQKYRLKTYIPLSAG